MSPLIYDSHIPAPSFPDTSVFTFFFSPAPDGTLGGIPSSQPAFIDAETGITLTRLQLRDFALSFAYGLRNYPGLSLTRGDTILIFAPNNLHWPVVLFGAAAAGLRITLANSAYIVDELKFQFEDSRSKLVLTTRDGLDRTIKMFEKLGFSNEEARKRIVLLGDSLQWAVSSGVAAPSKQDGITQFEELLSQGRLEQEEPFEGKLSNETVYLCYSSGTTGNPKGVETTHRNIISMVQGVHELFVPQDMRTSKMLCVLPFYHIYGAGKLLHFPLRRGVPVVIMARFDPVQFCTNIQKYNITVAAVVPPIILFLAKHPVVSKFDLSSLSLLFSGAAPLGHSLVSEAMQRLLSDRKASGKNTELQILQGYGLTETSPTSHMLPDGEGIRKAGSIGYLVPGLRARLVTDEGMDAKTGEPGELWLQGPSVMKGYLNNPQATANCMTKDKWFMTGDVATRDKEGFFYIVDRKKELIKYKGFQVPPAELEGVLLTHPEIVDAAVIGVDSPAEATELPRAYIVHGDPSKLKDKDAFTSSVATWIQGKVAKHKYLRGGVVLIDVIPKSAAGKILRRQLRDQAKVEFKPKL